LGDKKSEDGKVRINPRKREIEGSVRTFGSFAGRYGGARIYFVARFDQEASGYGTWNGKVATRKSEQANGDEIGVFLNFSGDRDQIVINLQVALSYVSVENARENLDSEVGDSGFDEIAEKAKIAWENKLNLIQIQTTNKDQKTIFYSALYHAFQMPTTFSDINGEYRGIDKKIHLADGFQYYTDMSIWDTFRNVHPLFILIDPQAQRDMLVSLVEMSKQGGGWLPRWPAGYGYTNSMLGTPADMVIAGSYLKGVRDFDVQTAYQAMRRTALEPTLKGDPYSGREGVEHYLKYGYCPAELMKEAVSRTLEFAYSDYAISLLARVLGYEADAIIFEKHSKYYKNVWNPETLFFQPRDTSGNFVKKFDPLMLTYVWGSEEYTNDYVEGSAMQWRWAVPFDPKGLISLFKSQNYFISELNNFFALSDPGRGEWNPGSYYWHGNEPDLYSAYLFNEAGRPDLTQKWVRWILENKYANSYDGLDGNDDAGTLSAWYVFSALGFYPLAGTDIYQVGAPLFRRADIRIGGKTIKIKAENYSADNIYVKRFWLNDSLLNRRWIKHDEIAAGVELRFEMTSRPLEINM
jgi:predicted alpha-1,2-mannosidase